MRRGEVAGCTMALLYTRGACGHAHRHENGTKQTLSFEFRSVEGETKQLGRSLTAWPNIQNAVPHFRCFEMKSRNVLSPTIGRTTYRGLSQEANGHQRGVDSGCFDFFGRVWDSVLWRIIPMAGDVTVSQCRHQYSLVKVQRKPV
jgi:hypothetical protein